MAKKKKSVKRKVSAKPMMKSKWDCSWIFAKLGAMAFILFLITVWPAAMALVHKIHWGWFLGATVVLCVIKMICYKNCSCKM